MVRVRLHHPAERHHAVDLSILIRPRQSPPCPHLTSHPVHDVAVISQRANGCTPAMQFSRFCGATALPNRFIPGTFTNQVVSLSLPLLLFSLPSKPPNLSSYFRASSTAVFRAGLLRSHRRPSPTLTPTLLQAARHHLRPQLLIATDPRADHHAILEAAAAGVVGDLRTASRSTMQRCNLHSAVVALCNSDSPLRSVDIAVRAAAARRAG